MMTKISVCVCACDFVCTSVAICCDGIQRPSADSLQSSVVVSCQWVLFSRPGESRNAVRAQRWALCIAQYVRNTHGTCCSLCPIWHAHDSLFNDGYCQQQGCDEVTTDQI